MNIVNNSCITIANTLIVANCTLLVPLHLVALSIRALPLQTYKSSEVEIVLSHHPTPFPCNQAHSIVILCSLSIGLCFFSTFFFLIFFVNTRVFPMLCLLFSIVSTAVVS